MTPAQKCDRVTNVVSMDSERPLEVATQFGDSVRLSNWMYSDRVWAGRTD